MQRLVTTPKLHFADSGLTATLRGTTAASFTPDETSFNRLLETEILNELHEQAGWFKEPLRFSHDRDKDGSE